jgi:hypothetical protein
VNVYGRIITRGDVRDAGIEHLKRWSKAYIGEVAVQRGKGRCDLPGFRSFRFSTEGVDKWAEDQLPACVVVCPGLADTPNRQGDGLHDGEWALGVGVIVSGRDQESTDELVGIYTAAVRAAMVQHPSLPQWVEELGKFVPFASGMRWIDEDAIPDLGFDDSRTIAGGRVALGVYVDSVVDSFGGPKTAPADPCVDPGDWGTVQATPLTTEQAGS